MNQNIDWRAIEAELDAGGCAVIPALLGAAECEALIARYDDMEIFRSRIVMTHHGFGQGEYKYFSAPVPEPIAGLRAALYPRLVPLANRWAERLSLPTRYPPAHAEFLARCHAAGQNRPTPLLLKYGPGDYNCLHQDLYGDLAFPLQATILLSDPATFGGGEFVLVEQRPRMQSRAEVVKLRRGDAVIFAVNHRPIEGKRGPYRVAMRHGVSRVRSGARFTAGIIFHDAR